MDFIIGILLVIVIILILINFTSISMSDTINSGTCNSNNYNYTNQNNIPSPMLSKDSTALNNKINLNVQTYDYNKYFFM